MGLSMRAEDARIIAATLVNSLDMRGQRAELAEARRSIEDREWVVLFDVFTADGARLDGPLIVIVDERTRAARTFDSL